MRAVSATLFSLVFSLALLGCGASEPALVPVRGKVIYKGKATPKAELTFHPQFQGPGWMPVATVGDDGSFAVGTKKPGDGALPGRYKVTVVWRPANDGEGPNLLPPRYAQPQSTPLEIDVGSAPGEPVTFELTN